MIPGPPCALDRLQPLGSSRYAVLVLGLTACGGGSKIPSLPPEPGDQCRILSQQTVFPETLTVALTRVIDPDNAPRSTNSAEQFIFSQLYEGLIGADCTGRPVPALAESWRSYDNGRQWTFRLRDDARFWNGDRITARTVVSNWDKNLLREWGIPPASIFAIGDTVVSLGSSTFRTTVPLLLASPALAVTGPFSEETGWAQGTGSFSVSYAGSSGVVLASTNSISGSARPSVIEVRDAGELDTRDLIDSGIDLLIAGDPRVLDYARSQPQLESTPLPWDRTYVLLRTRPSLTEMTALATESRNALARDAVRREARGASYPFWWQELENCSERPSALPIEAARPDTSQRIVYDDSDPTAGDLATRLVALSNSDDGRRDFGPDLPRQLIATARTSANLARALGTGSDYGYVVTLPRLVVDACVVAVDLLATAPWLNAIVPLSRAIIPLVDTRQWVIARRGHVRLAIDFYGTPILRTR